jgi:hypothetical protein
VIRGQFFQQGASGWAMFCSVGSTTSLLAFRNNGNTQPATLSVSEDESYGVDLGDGKFGYANVLSVAQPADMLRRYRLMGGPKGPPFEHQGIETVFWKRLPVFGTSIWASGCNCRARIEYTCRHVRSI